MIPNPWWLRFMDGGNAKTSAIAAVAFAIGYMWGKGDKNHWHDIARRYDNQWQDHQKREHEYHPKPAAGHHTQREHERDNHRRYGEEHGR